jgi:putative transcriptional regulator
MNNVETQHHPDDNLLTEFSAGTLDMAQAIAVSAHLHYCPYCRNKVEKMNNIGAALFTMSEPDDTKENNTLSFETLMEHIDNTEPHVLEDTGSIASREYSSSFPTVVQKILAQQKLHWKRVTSGLKAANLASGQNKYGVYLQKIAAGHQVPQHDHRGNEITVVLRGSISDEDGVYQTGDFILKSIGDVHTPRASSNEDCLCLSIQQAPVRLTSILGRFVNPFLRINPI